MYVKFLKESEWIKKVKEELPPKEANFLINIYRNKTCIHESWIKKETYQKQKEIRKAVYKALEKGLLYKSRISFSSAIMFPIKKKGSKSGNHYW